MNNRNAAEVVKSVLTAKPNAKIKLLGDSITHGVGGDGWEQKGKLIVEGWAQSPDSYCWANMFRDYMKEKYSARVVNNACTGTTVEFIIRHFQTLVDGDDDLIVGAEGLVFLDDALAVLGGILQKQRDGGHGVIDVGAVLETDIQVAVTEIQRMLFDLVGVEIAQHLGVRGL